MLDIDPLFVKAKLAKAESLFNMCHFEHALLHYHQGQVSTRQFYRNQYYKRVHIVLRFNFEHYLVETRQSFRALRIVN